MTHPRLRSHFGIAAALLALLAGAASAQPEQRQERPLRGPAVEQNRPPQVEGQFTERMGPVGMGQRQTPHSEYMNVIWMLRDEEAPEGLRLSPAQERRIAEIDNRFQQAMRDHMERIRELGRTGREARPSEARPSEAPQGEGRPRDGERRERPAAQDGDEGRARPAMRRLTDEEREQMEELRRNMPRPADAQTRIWNELNEVQQAFVNDELEDRRRIAERRREEEMMRRRMEAREGGGEMRRGPGAFGGPEGQAQRQRIGRAIQQLQQLPPEERERIFQILEAEIERSVAAHPPAEGRTGGWGTDAERERRIQRWRDMQREREEGGEAAPGQQRRRQRPQEDPR